MPDRGKEYKMLEGVAKKIEGGGYSGGMPERVKK